MSLRAKLILLSFYPLVWVEGVNPCGHSRGLVDYAFVDEGAVLAATPCPAVQHIDCILSRQVARSELPSEVLTQPHWLVHFDGGSGSKLGTGGFVIYDQSGQLVRAIAKWYGPDRPTNNQAEFQSMLDALEALRGCLPADKKRVPVVVVGDSQLVIDFCNRQARPGNPVLFRIWQDLQVLQRKKHWRLHFRHVPRA